MWHWTEGTGIGNWAHQKSRVRLGKGHGKMKHYQSRVEKRTGIGGRHRGRKRQSRTWSDGGQKTSGHRVSPNGVARARAQVTVGGSGGAVKTVMRAMTPCAFVTSFASSEVAGTMPIVPWTADFGIRRGAQASPSRRLSANQRKGERVKFGISARLC